MSRRAKSKFCLINGLQEKSRLLGLICGQCSSNASLGRVLIGCKGKGESSCLVPGVAKSLKAGVVRISSGDSLGDDAGEEASLMGET